MLVTLEKQFRGAPLVIPGARFVGGKLVNVNPTQTDGRSQPTLRVYWLFCKTDEGISTAFATVRVQIC